MKIVLVKSLRILIYFFSFNIFFMFVSLFQVWEEEDQLSDNLHSTAGPFQNLSAYAQTLLHKFCSTLENPKLLDPDPEDYP